VAAADEEDDDDDDAHSQASLFSLTKAPCA
jgi:hypothetical protein